MKRIILEALNLSTNERIVINIMRQQREAEKISTISKQCRMPHTTVSYVLRKLENRKLITRVKVNNHYRWRYRKNLDLLENASPESFQSALFDVAVGTNHAIKEFMRILELAPTERLYSIQGAGLSKDILKKIDMKFLHSFHSEIKRKQIIIDGIMAESVLNLMKNMSTEQLQSHLDRLTVVYILPDELIPFSLDIFVFRNSILLIDYKTERIVRIEESSLAGALKTLYKIAQLQGKKIDLNKYIRELISQTF
jgi:predicted transcriptional regulator